MPQKISDVILFLDNIRDLLGHVSIMTTEVYARTDSLHKREALESAYEKVGITEPSLASWEKDPKFKTFLKSFGYKKSKILITVIKSLTIK